MIFAGIFGPSEERREMKIHNLKIGIRPLEDGLREFGKTLKTIQAGKPVRKRSGLYFVSVEAMRRVLT